MSDASPKYNIRACKKIYIISEKDAPANKNRRAGPSCAAVCTRKTDSLLALLVFQLLFFGNVGFHLGLCPALQIGLALPGDAQRLCGHVLGDGAAGGGVGTIAHLHGGHKVRVAADEAVIADRSAELILAVVVAGDGAAAEVAVLAHVAVADIGQVAHCVAPGKVGVLGLHVCTQMHAVVGDGVHPHMGEWADVVVRADVAAVHLTGVDGAALVYDAVLNEGVGADDAARTDDRSAAQDGTGQNDGTRGDDHVRCDLHGAAVDDHAVCDVLQQNDLAGGFGGIQLLTRCIQRSRRNRIFHTIDLPSGTAAPGGQMIRPDPGKMMHPYPKMDTTEALRRQKRKAEITGIESCIQQADNPRQKTKNLSNFLPFYTTLKLGKFQGICIKNNRQIRDFAWWKGMDFLV